MFYSIRHYTRFVYSAAVSESIMEVRMQPRTEGLQRCLNFQLSVDPRARIFSYRDYLGNTVHLFDVPGHHRRLEILADALVDTRTPEALPTCLGHDAWEALDHAVAMGDYWEMLMPSHFARSSPLFDQFARELGFGECAAMRERDPLQLLLAMNAALYNALTYARKSTRVDSPIEDALEARKGVCQDFAHIMITMVRRIGIPCRYVSGYLFHRPGEGTRSAEGASHAWVEAFLPPLGWVGLDPTNNVIADERHVRTAVGRDYGDVPPTRGTFKGAAESELTVQVRVALSDSPPPDEDPRGESWHTAEGDDGGPESTLISQQQQQQQ